MTDTLILAVTILGGLLILVPAWPLPVTRYLAICAGLVLIGISGLLAIGTTP